MRDGITDLALAAVGSAAARGRTEGVHVRRLPLCRDWRKVGLAVSGCRYRSHATYGTESDRGDLCAVGESEVGLGHSRDCTERWSEANGGDLLSGWGAEKKNRAAKSAFDRIRWEDGGQPEARIAWRYRRRRNDAISLRPRIARHRGALLRSHGAGYSRATNSYLAHERRASCMPAFACCSDPVECHLLRHHVQWAEYPPS